MNRDYNLIQQLHEAIDRKFEQNKHKGTWRNMTDTKVLAALCIEVDELVAARTEKASDPIEEAADVALYAIFYADPQRI